MAFLIYWGRKAYEVYGGVRFVTDLEMAGMFNVTVNYMKNQWSAFVRRKASQGIELVKVGKGPTAAYGYKSIKDADWIWEVLKDGRTDK